MSIKSLSLASCFSLALLVAPALGVDIAGNGGFESGTGGDSDLWTEFAGGPAGTQSVRDGSNPNSGSWAHLIESVGDPTAGANAGINQNSIADVGFGSLVSGTSVSASFSHDTTLGPGGVAFANLKILNGIGAIVLETGPQALPATLGYAPFTTPSLVVPATGAAPNDVYATFLEINVAAGAFQGSFGTSYIDDVVINGTVVPEPTSIMMVCGLGLGFVTRRRR
ncbi:MAG: PEP-CTERM sorting domain-containing protein [Planctomycetota bacterium]